MASRSHPYHKLIENEHGSTMPIFAISLMAILSLVGATIALGMDSTSGNQLQSAADASALGGATAFLNSEAPKASDRLVLAQETARALAQRNADYALTALDVSALTEDAYGQHTQIAVELESRPVNLFSNFAGDYATAPMRRRSVAGATWGFPLCVLTLARDKEGLNISEFAELSADGCVIWSNSTSEKSMIFAGGRSTAKAFCAVGTTVVDSKSSVQPRPEEGCEPLPDPLAGYDLPVSPICDHKETIKIKLGSQRLTPGVYCDGLEIKARNVDFEPGIYVIRGGKIKIDAHGLVRAQGVTLLLDGDVSSVEIKSLSGLRLVAPPDGPSAGIALAQLPSLKKSEAELKVEGELNVEGVIYVPSFNVEFSKLGGGTTASPYLQLVANRLSMKGQAGLQINFDMASTDLPLVIKPAKEARLLE